MLSVAFCHDRPSIVTIFMKLNTDDAMSVDILDLAIVLYASAIAEQNLLHYAALNGLVAVVNSRFTGLYDQRYADSRASSIVD